MMENKTEIKNHHPDLVVFLCENSAGLALEDVDCEFGEFLNKMQMIRVPCAGKIDELYMLRALENGADGVLILACHKENCNYLKGNIRAEKRTERIKEMLEEIDYSPLRVGCENLAPNQNKNLVEIIKQFTQGLKSLDPNPGVNQPGSDRKAVKA